VEKISNLVSQSGGVAAVLGGGMWSATIFLAMNDALSDSDRLSAIVFFTVSLLLLAGLVGLYARCREQLGEWEALSLMGFLTSLAGLLVSGVGLSGVGFDGLGYTWLSELSWWMSFFGYFLLNLGLLFLGNSVLQSRALGRLRGLPLVIGIVGALSILIPPWSVPGAVLWVLYGLGWVALGFVLLVEGKSAAGRSASGEPETNV
jgi:hypothetical protein